MLRFQQKRYIYIYCFKKFILFKLLTHGRSIKHNILDFFLMGAFATKSLEKSRIFEYGLPEVFFSKGKTPKPREGGVQRPTPLRY